MRKLITIIAALATLCACSPAQTRAWLRWHREEPRAAEQWAANECGALCTDDWDRDGVVEPEPADDATPSDDSATSTETGDWDGDGVVEPDSPSPEASSPTDSSGDGDVPDEVFQTIEGTACEQWSDTALAAGWTVDQWYDPLSRIMARESNCDPGAYNSSGASGLLQIMPDWADNCGGSPDDLFDPWFNLSCGLVVLSAQGWGAWSTY